MEALACLLTPSRSSPGSPAQLSSGGVKPERQPQLTRGSRSPAADTRGTSTSVYTGQEQAQERGDRVASVGALGVAAVLTLMELKVATVWTIRRADCVGGKQRAKRITCQGAQAVLFAPKCQPKSPEEVSHS